MGFAHIHKKKLNLVTPAPVIKPLDVLNRSRCHGTSGGTEGQDHIFFAAKIAEPENIAFQAAQLEIGRAVPF